MALLEQVGFFVDVDNDDGTFILSRVVLRTVRTAATLLKKGMHTPLAARTARVRKLPFF
jgi:hypothetical protein